MHGGSTGQKAAQIRVPAAIKIFHGYGIRGKIDRRLATDSEADCDCVRRGNKSAATVEAVRENRAINSGYKAVPPNGPLRFLRSMQFHRFLQITDGVSLLPWQNTQPAFLNVILMPIYTYIWPDWIRISRVRDARRSRSSCRKFIEILGNWKHGEIDAKLR